MELYTSDSCVVGFVADRLELQCERLLTPEDFREGMLKALRFAREHGIKRWLLDFRSIGQLSEEEETWVQVHLFPQIMMHLGTDNQVALVVDERCYQDMVSESGLLGLKSYNSFIIINTFCDRDRAIEWLNFNQSESA